jgi:carbamoyl-phosphate synthase large subunit
MNVLITSASRKVSLINAFRWALCEEGGGQIIAIDASPKSAAFYFAYKAYVVPAGLGE